MRYPIPINPARLNHDPDRTQIVFHGINKSGSLSMSNVLREAYLFAGREPEFVSHYHSGGTTDDFITQLNATEASRSFVVSHYLFGALAPSPNRIWITQFRHPLPRVISCYQWLKNKHERTQSTPFPTLEQFVQDTRGVKHSQIMQLGAGYGPNGARRRKRLSPRDLYDISADHISASISYIGIAEYFEESIFMFAAACGVASVVPWKKDVRNKGRPAVSSLSESERNLIREYFSYDFALYEHALGIFRSQCTRLGVESRSLNEYRLACASQYKDRLIAPEPLLAQAK